MEPGCGLERHEQAKFRRAASSANNSRDNGCGGCHAWRGDGRAGGEGETVDALCVSRPVRSHEVFSERDLRNSDDL